MFHTPISDSLASLECERLQTFLLDVAHIVKRGVNAYLFAVVRRSGQGCYGAGANAREVILALRSYGASCSTLPLPDIAMSLMNLAVMNVENEAAGAEASPASTPGPLLVFVLGKPASFAFYLSNILLLTSLQERHALASPPSAPP